MEGPLTEPVDELPRNAFHSEDSQLAVFVTDLPGLDVGRRGICGLSFFHAFKHRNDDTRCRRSNCFLTKLLGSASRLKLMGHRFDPYKPHHPVCPNRGNHRRSKRGRFCGDSSRLFLSSRSLPTTTLSRVDSWPPVSASKNSVPCGTVSGDK